MNKNIIFECKFEIKRNLLLAHVSIKNQKFIYRKYLKIKAYKLEPWIINNNKYLKTKKSLKDSIDFLKISPSCFFE